VPVFAALQAVTPAVLTVQHLTSMTAATGGEWWRRGARSQPGIPVTVSVDNARDPRWALVPTVAETVGMEWLS
jgi:hypothetical protein